MPTIAMGLSYDGTHYHGWQIQKETETIQACVERALSIVANQTIATICAGRTDTGVHATEQVIHFHTEAKRENLNWVFGTNNYLPHDIRALWAIPVPDHFSARFSATMRCYRYLIYNHRIRPAILKDGLTWYYRPLQERPMQEAAQYLVGTHDFSSLRGANCQASSPIRTIHQITVTRRHALLIIEVHANAFLLHMIRNIAGVLVAVGTGNQPPHFCNTMIKKRNRSAAEVTMPPKGLYFVKVRYPDEFQLPNSPMGPFFL